jgi:hypothetical protein
MKVLAGPLPLIASIGVVMGTSTLPPLVGACGTAHHLLVAVVSAVALLATGLPSPQPVRLAVFVAVNTLLFALPAIALHWNRSELSPFYPRLLIGWLLLFLVSYFVLFPSADCP